MFGKRNIIFSRDEKLGLGPRSTGVSRQNQGLGSVVSPAPDFLHTTLKSPIERVLIKPYPRVLQESLD